MNIYIDPNLRQFKEYDKEEYDKEEYDKEEYDKEEYDKEYHDCVMEEEKNDFKFNLI